MQDPSRKEKVAVTPSEIVVESILVRVLVVPDDDSGAGERSEVGLGRFDEGFGWLGCCTG